MKKEILKSTLLALSLCTLPLVVSADSQTVEDTEYVLDPVVVTAQRYEKHDLDVPATTSIIGEKELKNTGATTMEEALRFTTGIVFKAETAGSGGGEFLVRGKRRGTLVMVDGVPLNFRTGYYDLDTIPIEQVKQVEIIRGGGAVLYGSDTTGGIINIITKKKQNNSVTLSAGNFGRQRHDIQLQNEKMGLGFVYDKKGAIEKTSLPSLPVGVSSKYFDFRGGEKYIFNFKYDLNDKWRFSSDYVDHSYGRQYNYAFRKGPAIYDIRDTYNKEWRNVLHYDGDNGVKGNIYVDRATSRTEYKYYDYADKTTNVVKQILDKKYIYDARDEKVGFDVQKEWKNDQNTYLLGASFHREMYSLDLNNKPVFDSKTGAFKKYEDHKYSTYGRNVYSLFGQWERLVNAKNTIITSVRETWTGNSPDGTEYSQFTPQLQFLHKANDRVSYYASYSKSFTLPTMTDMYGNGNTLKNPSIRPERGNFYEAGVKIEDGDKLWKVALFKSAVKDFIRLKENKNGDSVAYNEDTKNQGFEVSLDIKKNNGWSGNFGVSISDPKYFESNKPENGWLRNYGRVQVNGGLTYAKEKWVVSLQGNYLGKRVLQSAQETIRPLFITSLHAQYKVNAEQEVFLDIDNLLDRDDITSHVSSRYNALPLNYRLGYRYKF